MLASTFPLYGRTLRLWKYEVEAAVLHKNAHYARAARLHWGLRLVATLKTCLILLLHCQTDKQPSLSPRNGVLGTHELDVVRLAAYMDAYNTVWNEFRWLLCQIIYVENKGFLKAKQETRGLEYISQIHINIYHKNKLHAHNWDGLREEVCISQYGTYLRLDLAAPMYLVL